jgi:thiol-disulfide isomerase/thioredoxin
VTPDPGLELVFYTAPGCCLCDEARAVLAPFERDLEIVVRSVDISGDPVLEARYREHIPVGEIGGRVVFKYRVDPDRLRRFIAEAGA